MKQPVSTGAVNRFKDIFKGDRKFYHAVFVLVLPIIVQNAITHFVKPT